MNIEGLASGRDVVTVEIETPFSVSSPCGEVGEWGEREGGQGKEGRQGGVVSRAILSRVCPARVREEMATLL